MIAAVIKIAVFYVERPLCADTVEKLENYKKPIFHLLGIFTKTHLKYYL